MNVIETIPKLIRASLEADVNSVEVISLTLSKMLRRNNKKIADEIDSILFNRNVGKTAYRSIGLSDIPKDSKNSARLISIRELNSIMPPVLDEETQDRLDEFLLEQKRKLDLIEMDIKPTNSILLYGEPGVGKTYTAEWIASSLNKPLVTLDLATIMSSYLGETGTNIKKVLDYSKTNDCILFLDEFDAIAKTRTDDRELGEMKRIVNVLLKELEEWPLDKIIIAATNHEQLLDKAIWRRFDLRLNLKLPTNTLIRQLVNNEFSKFEVMPCFLDTLSLKVQGQNCAEIVRICNQIKKEAILYNKSVEELILQSIQETISSMKKPDKLQIVSFLNSNGKNAEEIHEITSIPKSSIYKYLKWIKEEKENAQNANINKG